MRHELLTPLAEALKARRKARRLTQADVARRIGRSPSRVSELEGDLATGRIGKDRLGTLAEVCDALDLVPILIPRERAPALQRQLEQGSWAVSTSVAPLAGRAFDELFVDLSDDGLETD